MNIALRERRRPGVPRWAAWLAAAVILGSLLAVAFLAGPSIVDRTLAIPSAAMSVSAASAAVHSLSSGNVVPEAAGDLPTWINVTNPTASPPPMNAASSAYDPVARETVLFGGCGNAFCPSNETWVFSGGNWVNVTDPSAAPPARSSASMDYDANMHGILLFGGLGLGGVLDDTWLFTGHHWVSLSWVSGPPPARDGAAMAFDPQPEENGSVLFGGYLNGGPTTNDTWVWQGWSGWVRLNTTLAPAPVENAGFAYSATDGYALLFGGLEVCGIFCFGVVNQSWELYAGEWWPTTPTGLVPQPRAGASVGYDPSLPAIVLFGGTNASFGFLQDTWMYAHGSWSRLSTPASLQARFLSALSPDAGPVAPILFGGTGNASNVNDTWVLETQPGPGLSTSSTTVETSLAVTFTVTVTGGSSPYRALIDFGDGSTSLVTGPGPLLSADHVYGSPGAVTASVAVTDAVGVVGTGAMPSFTVLAGPAFSVFASPSRVDAGHAVRLGAWVTSPGSPPLTFSWNFGDGSTGSGANVSHVYAAPGSYAVAVNATDGAGGTATAAETIVVASIPSVQAGASPASATAGIPVSLFGNVSGGTAPFSYTWDFGDGSRSGATNPIHTFGNAGTYTVNLWANDSGGGSAHATVTVTVGAASVAAASVPGWFWPSLAALIAIGAGGVAFVVFITRRSRPPKASPPP